MPSAPRSTGQSWFAPPKYGRALAIVALLPAVALAACSQQGSTASGASAAANSATITTAWPSDVTTLDPANLSTSEDHELARNIYQTLESPAFTAQSNGSLKYDGASVKPELAQSWAVGTDSITYHLRPGVKFYGTSDVMTAEDVKWSLDRIWSTPGAGDLEANGLHSPNDIHVVNQAALTIDFKTTAGKPTPVTPTLMAIFDQPFTSIIDENAVKPHETCRPYRSNLAAQPHRRHRPLLHRQARPRHRPRAQGCPRELGTGTRLHDGGHPGHHRQHLLPAAERHRRGGRVRNDQPAGQLPGRGRPHR